MSDNFIKKYRESFGVSPEKLLEASPLALAYIGDSIYDFVVRDYVICHFPGNINRMNKEKTRLVCAQAQAEIMGYLIGGERLSEEEMAVYRRARNHKSDSHSKNSSIVDYRRATGFEALLGYLYGKESYDRMLEIISLGLHHLLSLEDAKKQGEE